MRDEWRERVDQLSDEMLATLAREKELGELNFAPVVDKLRVIRRVVESLALEDENELPAQIVNQISPQLDQVINLISQIQAFTLAQDQAATQRQTLATQVENYREWFVQMSVPTSEVLRLISQARRARWKKHSPMLMQPQMKPRRF